jgi:hypothetical protein
VKENLNLRISKEKNLEIAFYSNENAGIPCIGKVFEAYNKIRHLRVSVGNNKGKSRFYSENI